MANRYILFFKPYDVLSTFTDPEGRQTLGSYVTAPGVYAAGRLDQDSEGLMLLTDDGRLAHVLTDPDHKLPKTYFVQVENEPDKAAISQLRRGVVVKGEMTLPAEVDLLDEEPDLPPRSVPIRYRPSIPTRWLRIVLREGRKRQIRHMTAAVGHPTLRLVRVAIGPLTLRGLQPGQWRDLAPEELEALKNALGIAHGAGTATQPREAPRPTGQRAPAAGRTPSGLRRPAGASRGPRPDARRDRAESERGPRPDARRDRAENERGPQGNRRGPVRGGVSSRWDDRSGPTRRPERQEPAGPSRTRDTDPPEARGPKGGGPRPDARGPRPPGQADRRPERREERPEPQRQERRPEPRREERPAPPRQEHRGETEGGRTRTRPPGGASRGVGQRPKRRPA